MQFRPEHLHAAADAQRSEALGQETQRCHMTPQSSMGMVGKHQAFAPLTAPIRMIRVKSTEATGLTACGVSCPSLLTAPCQLYTVIEN